METQRGWQKGATGDNQKGYTKVGQFAMGIRGSFTRTKSFVVPMIWRFDGSGSPFLDSKTKMEIKLTSPIDGSDFCLPVKSPYPPNKHLGTWKARNLMDSKQYQVLKQKASGFWKSLLRTAPTKRGALMLYTMVYMPRASYALLCTSLNKRE